MTASAIKKRAWLNAVDGSLIGLIVLLGSWCVWAIATQDKLWWVDLIFDDGYYYLGIARNLVEHGRSSFLPPFDTNGYQPLWLLLLSATGWLLGTGERALAIQLVVLVMVFMLLFAAASRHYHGRAWPAALVSAAFPGVMAFGLETAMLPVLVLAFFNTERWWARGGLASAIFLTRLDALALVVMRDAHALLIRREKIAAFKHWLILAPVIGVYFYLNWHWFGTALPVSGLAKSVGNVMGENVLPLILYPYNAKFALLALAGLFAVHRLTRGRLALRYARESGILLCTMAACAAYYSVMSGWPLWDWYYWPAMLLTYYAMLESLYALPQRAAVALGRGAEIVLGVLIAALFVWVLRVSGGTSSHYVRTIREAASERVGIWSFGKKNVLLVDEIRQGKLPQGAFLAMGDRAGSLGYFLGNGYRFIHTEGLVGPYEYMRAMRADVGGEFIATVPVDYLLVDRERYFETADVVGVVEPIQGWSAHKGQYMLCFAKAGIVDREAYEGQTRLLIDFRRKVACPAEFTSAFKALQPVYGGMRRFTLPSDYRAAPLKWFGEAPAAP